jgi:hypothetical protein
MNNASSHFPRLATGLLWAVALGVCFSLPGLAGGSQFNSDHGASTLLDCSALGPETQYDEGDQTTVAAHGSGQLIEFHQTQAPGVQTIWYRIGTTNGASATWGVSQNSGVSGYWPVAAFSSSGRYVILVYADIPSKLNARLYYRIGQITPYGSLNQSIRWLTDSLFWDAGFHASIAVNKNGLIVGVHESGMGGDGLYYRVGSFQPETGKYAVQWTSPSWGIYYNDGINPSISLNNLNQVVAVHQVPGESLLHYWRGTVSAGTINFAESRRYDNYAEQPAVVLLDSGLVFEVHKLGGLIYRTGRLNPSNDWEIKWNEPIKLDDAPGVSYPALATDGMMNLITTYQADCSLFGGCKLMFRVTRLCEQYANGTLVRGSTGKVYVMLNDYRHWIPDETTFEAMGYKWKSIIQLSDSALNAIPEGDPFPSVAPVSGPLNYPNGTVLKGSGDKVYVVLNNYRYWIPDPATFDAMGYKGETIIQYPDNVVNAIPEGKPFPSVAR